MVEYETINQELNPSLIVLYFQPSKMKRLQGDHGQKCPIISKDHEALSRCTSRDAAVTWDNKFNNHLNRKPSSDL